MISFLFSFLSLQLFLMFIFVLSAQDIVLIITASGTIITIVAAAFVVILKAFQAYKYNTKNGIK